MKLKVFNNYNNYTQTTGAVLLMLKETKKEFFMKKPQNFSSEGKNF